MMLYVWGDDRGTYHHALVIESTQILMIIGSTTALLPQQKSANYTKPDRVFIRTRPINQPSATASLATGVLTALIWAQHLPETPPATPTPAGSSTARKKPSAKSAKPSILMGWMIM